MNFNEDGELEEPCLTCKYAYIEDIWYEWCCRQKECPYKAESEPQESEVDNGNDD